MKISHRPIQTTLFFGLICGLSFIPVSLVLNHLLPGVIAICLTLWLYTTVYALLLSRWSKNPILSGGFPLLLLFIFPFLVDSLVAYYLLSLVVIGWIRSGICFSEPRGRKLIAELLLCVFGGILMVFFTPASTLAWVPCIWMFFLIQTLYLVIFETEAATPEDRYETDPFERAAMQAEAILSNL